MLIRHCLQKQRVTSLTWDSQVGRRSREALEGGAQMTSKTSEMTKRTVANLVNCQWKAWSFDEETMRSGLVQQQFDLLKFKNQDRVLIQSTSDEKAPSE